MGFSALRVLDAYIYSDKRRAARGGIYAPSFAYIRCAFYFRKGRRRAFQLAPAPLFSKVGEKFQRAVIFTSKIAFLTWK